MSRTRRSWINDAGVIAATLLLPLAGAAMAGRDLASLFRFPPPLAIPAGYPTFSWATVALVLSPFAALLWAWLRHGVVMRRTAANEAGAHADRNRSFPWWGTVAAAWILGWWTIAWSRFEVLAAWQRYTFFPLWIGFIFLANAIVVWRRGTSTMLRMPARWGGLFVASAVFWWLFEWLNRFTANWHYLGIADFGATAYAVHATLCFSTVLPAVAAVAELLDSSAGFTRRCERGPALTWFDSRAAGLVLLALGTASLVGAGASPWLFYAALWCAPLALALGGTVVTRGGGIPFTVARGDWRIAATWAVAALICGVFWELWNFRSAAKWVYTVPYADRWHLFEMPLLGYLGYLPFGLECHLVAGRVLGLDGSSSNSRSASTGPWANERAAAGQPLDEAAAQG